MTVEERLDYERRSRWRMSVVAGLAALLLVIAAVIQVSGPHTKVDELTLDLIYAHKRWPRDPIGSIINGFGLIAVGFTLSYLLGCASFRNPTIRLFIRWLAIVGGILAAIAGVSYSFLIASKAKDFVNSGNQTYAEAHHLTHGAGIIALPLLGQGASLLLAIAFILISLGAMRVGLLTKFLGYLGMFAGVLVLIPIGSPVPVVQGFWLLSVAYLVSGRWPTGLPPAWVTGHSVPWPTQAERRAQLQRSRNGGAPKPASAGAPATAPPVPARTRAETPKRKRKRRS
jgi:hypothetical protein